MNHRKRLEGPSPCRFGIDISEGEELTRRIEAEAEEIRAKWKNTIEGDPGITAERAALARELMRNGTPRNRVPQHLLNALHDDNDPRLAPRNADDTQRYYSRRRHQ